jgi:hypothetical protein
VAAGIGRSGGTATVADPSAEVAGGGRCQDRDGRQAEVGQADEAELLLRGVHARQQLRAGWPAAAFHLCAGRRQLAKGPWNQKVAPEPGNQRRGPRLPPT